MNSLEQCLITNAADSIWIATLTLNNIIIENICDKFKVSDNMVSVFSYSVSHVSLLQLCPLVTFRFTVDATSFYPTAQCICMLYHVKGFYDISKCDLV